MQILEILKYIEENKNSAFFYTPNFYEEGKSYLFKEPFEILKAKTKVEVEKTLTKVDELLQNPEIIGFATIPYETGYYFQPKDIKGRSIDETELCFYFYKKEEVEIINSDDIEFDEIENEFKAENGIKDFELEISKEEYVEKIEKIKDYIAKGDTYQINFTTKANFNFTGKISSLFLNGIFNQSAKYSALINSGDHFILSFSPELFFETDSKSVTAKPMKGTIKRKANPNEDLELTDKLLHDEKNLAENVMIVDLLRNDIGKIADLDSVKVNKLYEVEKYETLYQLTSTVKGKLKQNKLSEIIKNLFPSGSITGAPKIRSMQIIAELEKSPRNLYTGSIGIFDHEKAVFNIPIRTVRIEKKTKKGELGLGSGIVWDSDAEKEFEEVLLKGKFISQQKPYFELLETILWENGEYFLLDYHLQRIKKSAEYFLFKFDEHYLKKTLEGKSVIFDKTKRYKARVLLTKWGKGKLEFSEISKSVEKAKVMLKRISSNRNNKFCFHKTTFRPWDEDLQNAKKLGFDEIIYVNEKDEILEGAISNILIIEGNKKFTPPVSLGILNGCYRKYLIQNELCQEKVIKINDLKIASKLYLCNSVRKKIEISKVQDEHRNTIYNT